jgi:Uma2 family endonuclease
MPSRVRLDDHGEPHLDLATWMGTYKFATPGVRGGDNTTARLALANRPQPDLLLLISPDRDGQARINRDGYVEGGPELVAEVAASSAAIDLHDKFDVYRQNQVREYLVWRVLDREVDWFVLRGERYERLAPDEAGVIRSEVFPGLWLNVPALVGGNPAPLLTTLQQGLASPDHAAFVARLNPPAS